jgi:hypothetical protein
MPIPDKSTQIPTGLPTGTGIPTSTGLPTSLPFPIPTSPSGRRRNDPRNDPRYPRNDPRTDPTSMPPSRPPASMPSQRGTTVEEYEYGEEYLNQLATRTGGRVHVATSLMNLNDAFAKIASELREFYSIGYYPKDDGEPGKTRRIKVRVNQENMVVRARDSYVVPKTEVARRPSIK